MVARYIARRPARGSPEFLDLLFGGSSLISLLW
nr:MAG TPA: hypothetical protein [Caudoviricetes sp.]